MYHMSSNRTASDGRSTIAPPISCTAPLKSPSMHTYARWSKSNEVSTVKILRASFGAPRQASSICASTNLLPNPPSLKDTGVQKLYKLGQQWRCPIPAATKEAQVYCQHHPTSHLSYETFNRDAIGVHQNMYSMQSSLQSINADIKLLLHII